MSEEIIKFFGGATILLSVIAWLIRSIIIQFLAKDLVAFRQDLVSSTEREMAELASKLEIERTKQQITLSNLQSRRQEFLEELYKRLVKFSGAAGALSTEVIIDDDEELKKKANLFIDEFFEFYNFYNERAILLSSDLEESIEKLHKDHFYAALDIRYNNESSNKSAILEFRKNSSKIQSESYGIKSKIASEFRALIGVEI